MGCGRWLQLPSLNIGAAGPPPGRASPPFATPPSHWTVSTVLSRARVDMENTCMQVPTPLRSTPPKAHMYRPERRERSPCPSSDRSRLPCGWLWLCVVTRLSQPLSRPAKISKKHPVGLLVWPKSAHTLLPFLPSCLELRPTRKKEKKGPSLLPRDPACVPPLSPSPSAVRPSSRPVHRPRVRGSER